MSRRGGTMTGTLTAIWRILIWGLAAVLLVAVWLNYNDPDDTGAVTEADTPASTDTETTADAEAPAGEEPVVARPGEQPELEAETPTEAAVDAAPDEGAMPEGVMDATDGGTGSDAILLEDGAAETVPASDPDAPAAQDDATTGASE